MSGWTEHAEDFVKLTEARMPDMDQGDSKLTQWLVAVNKLIYKWYNDGDVYDNRFNISGWCNDISGAANWLFAHMGDDYAEVLVLIKKVYSDQEYEDKIIDEIKKISNRISLDQARVDQLAATPVIGNAYNEDGPFQFVDRGSEEDEDD